MVEERPIYTHARKMFVIGFMTSMKSTLEISYKLLYKTQSPLKFVPHINSHKTIWNYFLLVFVQKEGVIIIPTVTNLKIL